MKRARMRGGWLLEIVVLVGLLGVWQATTAILRVPPYLVPQPTALAVSLSTFHSRLLAEAAQTLAEATAGFIGGNLLGLGLAVVFVHSRTLEHTFLPWMVVLKTLPIVAVTPLLTLVLGFGAPTIVAIASLISFFPALVNGVLGLRSVTPQSLELLRLLDASGWTILRRLRLPSAVPFIFAALRVSAPASILAAMVAEWAAANGGLGYLILDAGARYQFLLMWDAMLVATLLAVLAFATVDFAEGRLTTWTRYQSVPGR
jgi:NitT/TauT family transport system permease protein